MIRDWKWDGTLWNSETTREISLESGGEYSITAGITSENYLGVSLSTQYHDVTGMLEDQVISFSRFRDAVGGQSATMVSIMPTPVLSSENTVVLPDASPVPTANSQILFDSNDPSEGISKNLVGIALIVITAIAAFLLLRRRRSSV
jgi:hypothetical protein